METLLEPIGTHSNPSRSLRRKLVLTGMGLGLGFPQLENTGTGRLNGSLTSTMNPPPNLPCLFSYVHYYLVFIIWNIKYVGNVLIFWFCIKYLKYLKCIYGIF